MALPNTPPIASPPASDPHPFPCTPPLPRAVAHRCRRPSTDGIPYVPLTYPPSAVPSALFPSTARPSPPPSPITYPPPRPRPRPITRLLSSAIPPPHPITSSARAVQVFRPLIYDLHAEVEAVQYQVSDVLQRMDDLDQRKVEEGDGNAAAGRRRCERRRCSSGVRFGGRFGASACHRKQRRLAPLVPTLSACPTC